jgi:hypothetical protein
MGETEGPSTPLAPEAGRAFVQAVGQRRGFRFGGYVDLG